MTHEQILEYGRTLAAMAPGARQDEAFMRLALSLGRMNLGITAPNPSVGALLVKDGALVGYGMTAKGGRPHGEIAALAMAGENARAATLYVTLEPCCHYGQTPPCVLALLAAGVARVVVAMRDPDPRVGGKGLIQLRQQGVALVEGVCADEARRDHIGHCTRLRDGRPSVTLKLALTADGFAAGGEHEGRLFITGAAADAYTHELRAHHDAIACGINTVLADDPQLTVRIPAYGAGKDHRAPTRIVFDSALKIPLGARLVLGARVQPVMVVTTPAASPAQAGALENAGVVVVRMPADRNGRVDLLAALRGLAGRGLTRLFCEGGPTLASTLIEEGLVEEVMLMVSPHPLGRTGRCGLRERARACLERPDLFERLPDETLGCDMLKRYVRKQVFD